jgi:hypothetical protein
MSKTEIQPEITNIPGVPGGFIAKNMLTKEECHIIT